MTAGRDDAGSGHAAPPPAPAPAAPSAPAPAALPSAPAPASSPFPPPAPAPPAPRWTSWVLGVSVVVLAIGGVIMLFLLGQRLSGSGSASPDTAPPPPITVTAAAPSADPPPADPTVAAMPGTHPWTELAGGECLDPFTSPWVDELTVVDCAQPHAAQLVGKPVLNADPAASYPGEAAITGTLNLACTAPEVLAADATTRYADLQWQASYPVEASQWDAGQRSAWCFVSRSSGEPLTDSLAASPAPVAP